MHQCEVTYPAQQSVGDARRAATPPGDLGDRLAVEDELRTDQVDRYGR